jgi:hypothetical protein
MVSLAKTWCFSWVVTSLALIGEPKVWGSENEAILTEAIRGETGALRFGFYTQDRGPVKQGDRLEFHFPYTEEKNASVRILGTFSECGCLTQSMAAGQDVTAGSKGALVVRVDSTHFIGSFDKEVVILTNEERDRPHVFRMRATIERLLTVTPPVVQLDDKAVRVRVKSASRQTLHIEKVVYNEDTLDVQISQVQEAWELLVRWKGEASPAKMNETIELLTDGPVKSLKIPVVGMRSKKPHLSLSAPR